MQINWFAKKLIFVRCIGQGAKQSSEYTSMGAKEQWIMLSAHTNMALELN